MQWAGEIEGGTKAKQIKGPSATSQAIHRLAEDACQAVVHALSSPRPEFGNQKLVLTARLSSEMAAEIGADEEFVLTVDVPDTVGQKAVN